MPNSLGYSGYKLANTRPAFFINENIPNVPKHALTVICVHVGIHFLCSKSTNKLQEAENNINILWKTITPPGNTTFTKAAS